MNRKAAVLPIFTLVLTTAAAPLQAQTTTGLHATVAALSTQTLQAQPARIIVVSLQDRRLALVESGAVKKVYTVAVGRDSTPSPTGTFTIVDRVSNPTYYHDGKIIPPGPGNPVGTRWMGLSKKGYGIHGTNAPKSIGKAASHGCIRMAQPDLEDLFAHVRAGDTVRIIGERNQQTAALFGAPVTPAAAAPVLTAQTAPAPAAAQAAASAVTVTAVTAAIPMGN